jgi:hypothetical protein
MKIVEIMKSKKKNPGERWHKKLESQYAELYTEADQKGLRHHKDYFEGKADAHRDSAIVSRRMGMENPRDVYVMEARGKHYDINSKGEIRVGNYFSSSWKIYAIVPRWNMKPSFEYQWENIKKIMDKGKTVRGYVYDIDHGTLRFWGGRYYGKLPIAILWKSSSNPKFTREENPVSIPERVLAWREKLRPGTIMKPETFKYIKGVATRARYREPSAVGGKAYWVTLLSKYLRTHPGDTEVKRLHRQFVSRRYAGKNPFDIGTAGAIAAGITAGEVGKYALNKSGILRNPKGRELSVPEKHQLKIAYDTLKMTDPMVGVMGGMTKEEAREVIKRLTGKVVKNPRYNSLKNAVKIYDNILAIEAKKGKDSLFPNENFRHDFSKIKGKASVYGMPDGSLVIKGKKRLWKRFNYD